MDWISIYRDSAQHSSNFDSKLGLKRDSCFIAAAAVKEAVVIASMQPKETVDGNLQVRQKPPAGREGHADRGQQLSHLHKLVDQRVHSHHPSNIAPIIFARCHAYANCCHMGCSIYGHVQSAKNRCLAFYYCETLCLA